jgi:prepilin-type N-terminal cleavage/methylation domain-containing protein/prepilin-type processing-associated H-X9-DG protein
MNAPRQFISNKISVQRRDGFTLVELLVVIATVAVLAAMLLPALAATHPDSQAFQCMENHRQLILAWQMYAEDNNDLLPPNDAPYRTAYYTAGSTSPTDPAKNQWKNWVVGTMEQPQDAGHPNELLDPHTLLSPYITNAAVYHCPADNYLNPNNVRRINPRSVSMNSAVGTIYYTHTVNAALAIGSPVQGGWLPGTAYNNNQNKWLTYGKMSSFTRPGPANTWVIVDENPYTINDGSFAVSAFAVAGANYLIDYPSANHNGAAGMSFADGHVIIHKWLDSRTYNPQLVPGLTPGMGGTSSSWQSPDNPDCFYLAPITSAPR